MGKGAYCNPSDCLGATVNLADVPSSRSLILPAGLSSVDRCHQTHFKGRYDTGIGNAQPLSSKCQMSRALPRSFFSLFIVPCYCNTEIAVRIDMCFSAAGEQSVTGPHPASISGVRVHHFPYDVHL